MKLQKQIGFEFEIGSPIALRTVCNKIKNELNTHKDFNRKYNF